VPPACLAADTSDNCGLPCAALPLRDFVHAGNGTKENIPVNGQNEAAGFSNGGHKDYTQNILIFNCMEAILSLAHLRRSLSGPHPALPWRSSDKYLETSAARTPGRALTPIPVT